MSVVNEVTSFESTVIEADNVTEATRKYEELINQHMNDPRCKFSQEAGRHVYMKPVQYNLTKLGDDYIANITFIGTNKSTTNSRKPQS